MKNVNTKLVTVLFAVLPLCAATSALADPAGAERAFKSKCASCHGNDGKGKTKQGEKMKIGDISGGKDVAKIQKTIEEGISREKDGVKQEMKPLKDKLPPEQIKEIAEYVHGLK